VCKRKKIMAQAQFQLGNHPMMVELADDKNMTLDRRCIKTGAANSLFDTSYQ